MTTTPVPSITDDQLAEIEALAMKSGPDNWEKIGNNIVSDGEGPIVVLSGNENFPFQSGDNLRYAAAVDPKTILAMIARIRELEKMLILAKSVVDWAAEEGEASADLMAIAQARAVVIESAINNRSGEQE